MLHNIILHTFKSIQVLFEKKNFQFKKSGICENKTLNKPVTCPKLRIL